jgi:hypothetical protein
MRLESGAERPNKPDIISLSKETEGSFYAHIVDARDKLSEEKFAENISQKLMVDARFYSYLVSYPDSLTSAEWKEVYVWLGVFTGQSPEDLRRSGDPALRRAGFILQMAYSLAHEFNTPDNPTS